MPNHFLPEATRIHGLKASNKEIPRIGVVQFAMVPNVERCKKGILKALADNGYVDGKNVEIVYKNAQADFSVISSIMQDFVRREVNIIVPLSTPCVQAAVQTAGKRPENGRKTAGKRPENGRTLRLFSPTLLIPTASVRPAHPRSIFQHDRCKLLSTHRENDGSDS